MLCLLLPYISHKISVAFLLPTLATADLPLYPQHTVVFSPLGFGSGFSLNHHLYLKTNHYLFFQPIWKALPREAFSCGNEALHPTIFCSIVLIYNENILPSKMSSVYMLTFNILYNFQSFILELPKVVIQQMCLEK